MRKHLLILLLVCVSLCPSFAQTLSVDAADGTYIVVLKAPSVVEKMLETAAEASRVVRRQALFSGAMDEYQVSLERSQQRTIQSLTAVKPSSMPGGAQMSVAPRISVLERRSFLLNMLVVQCSARDLVELRKHPDVKAVYPNRSRKLHMDTAPTIVSAPAVWEMLGGVKSAGQGIRIGIIDSGVNQAHAMLTDPDLVAPPGFPKPAEFAAYTTNKVIVARDYIKTQYGYANQAVHSPQDELGHGTSVASVAAGVPVVTSYAPIQGMAPKAYLGNYKVFGRPGVNDNAQTAGIVAAIEDAVKDEMDVINLSLGGLATPPEDDPEQQAIAKAAQAGVLTVISAGNEGPNGGTISSPGTSPEALTIGATLNGRYFAYGMDVTSTDVTIPPNLALVGYVPMATVTIPNQIGPAPLASIASYDSTLLGCMPLPAGSLTGKLALVRRGTCTFAEKAAYAHDAGAIATVIYQNINEPPFAGGGAVLYPAVMIDKVSGEALQATLPGHSISATLRPQGEFLTFPWPSNPVASFSSRGPDILYAIKPDVVAPGQDILAASMSGGYSRGLQGTSFSAPIVAGAAALIFQLHPTWTPQNVKSSLVNAADKGATWNGQPARVTDAGNGRLNVERGAKTPVLLDPVSVSFGVIEKVPAADLQKTVKVVNTSSSASEIISAEVTQGTPHPSAQVSVAPLALNLGPGQSGEFVVKVHVVSPLQYGTFDGYLKLTSSISTSPVTASYWGAFPVEDHSVVLKVAQDGPAPYSSLSAARAAARPGATVEIQDSTDYKGSQRITTNRDGLPLNGLTLRAKVGQTPRLLPATLTDPGVVLIGVERVTLDGLTVVQSLYGVLGIESSGTISNSLLDLNRSGMGFENSRFSLVNTTIKRSTSAGLLAINSPMNLTSSTIQDNGEEGVVLSDSPAVAERSLFAQNKLEGVAAFGGSFSLFDSTVEKNQSTGVLLYQAAGLLKGNIIRDSTGKDSDGVWASGSIPVCVQDSQIMNNGRHGLIADFGASVRFLRNQVTGNKSLGFYLSGAAGTVESSWLKGNGRGVRSESSDLDISNSVISESTGLADGDGLYADKGKLTVRNSTIVKNQRKGIRIFSSEHLIANSILHQNSGGDLEGAQLSGVQNNIITESIYAGANGNIQVDPRFTDLASGDYSLRQSSPAIDLGNTDYPVGLVDAASLERSVDGNNDGVAKPDIGALEFNSKTWVPLALPVLSSRLDEFIGLAMVNTSAETAHVELTGFDVGGGQIGTSYKKDIPAGSQFSILLREALPSLKQGWARITSNKPDLMSFTLLGNSGLTQMDGAELAGSISSKLLFPEIRSQGTSDTQLYVVNLNAEDVELTMTYHSPTKDYPVSRTIKAHGSLAQAFSLAFGNATGGYLTIEAKDEKKALFAMELFGNGKSMAGLLGLDMTRPQATLFGAQLASTSAVDTILNVINVGTVAVDVTLEALDEEGNLVKSVVVNKLAAGQQYRKTAKEIFGLSQDLVGWVRIKATDGKLLGCLSFSDTAGNFMASLPLQAQAAREFVLGHVAQTDEVFTGVTLLNTAASSAMISLEVLDKTGASKGTAVFVLGENEKRARLLTEYVPNLARQEGGFVRVRSSTPIFGFELFGNYSLSFMAAVPQQVVAY